MSEAEGWEAFVKIRFAENDGEAFCPRCGCLALYTIKTRRKWKCKSCSFQFSVTSGTIFASHKLAFRDILYAIGLFTNGAKGVSAIQMCRDMNVQYKDRLRVAAQAQGGSWYASACTEAVRRGRGRWRLLWWLRQTR